MKKSVRPAVGKGSGDRGKSEGAGTGKASAKSVTAAPLSKVKLVTRYQLICLYVVQTTGLCVITMTFLVQVKSNDDLLAAMAGGNPASSINGSKTKKSASAGSAGNIENKPKTASGI